MLENSIVSPIYFEKILLKYIFNEVEVREKIFPFLSEDIFDDFNVKENIRTVLNFFEQNTKFPSIPEMKMEIKNKEVYDTLQESLNIDTTEYGRDYILGKIEDFFKRKMILNELASAASILKESDLGKLNNTPDNIREKMSFSFNTEIGLNIFSDKGEERFFDHLHKKDVVVSSGIPYVDKIIDGGFHEKTLNLFLAGTGGFKTGTMCSSAVTSLYLNKKVLYITLEMSEEKITERILANVFDTDINQLKFLTKEAFSIKFNQSKNKLRDKLIVKEFPPKSLNVNRLRNLLKELKIKNNFVPDIIYVDYLGLMIPVNTKGNYNSYDTLKIVSEELRAIAVEQCCPIVSAVQTNRGGIGTAVIDITDIADSIGITATADLIIGITQTDEYKAAGKFCWLILKNRYGVNGLSVNVCVDFLKMRIFADENEEQNSYEQPKKTSIVDDAAVDIIKSGRMEKKRRISDLLGNSDDIEM